MILHPYPTVTQRTRDDCGAAIVSSILRKHNIKHQYTRLCKELNVSNATGTEEADILNFLNGKGFRVWMTYDMTVDSLMNFIDTEIPVVLIIRPGAAASGKEEQIRKLRQLRPLRAGHRSRRRPGHLHGFRPALRHLRVPDEKRSWRNAGTMCRRTSGGCGSASSSNPPREQPRAHPVGKPGVSPEMLWVVFTYNEMIWKSPDVETQVVRNT